MKDNAQRYQKVEDMKEMTNKLDGTHVDQKDVQINVVKLCGRVINTD